MAIGLKEGRRMAAQARRWTLVKRILLLAAVIAIGVFAYETGATRTQYRIDRMEERLAAQDADIARLEAEKAELDRRRLAAVQGESALQARYDRERFRPATTARCRRANARRSSKCLWSG